MGSTMNILGVLVVSLGVLVSVGVSDSFDQDRAECADKLVGVATCLSYVSGGTKAPTADCCTGLKQVVADSKKCICVLLKDRDNPSLGFNINSTIAMNLPNVCHVPTNISKCVELLHLDPNSPDAKMFLGFQNQDENSRTSTNISPTGHGSSTAIAGEGKSDGERGIQISFGALVIGFLASHLLLHYV